MNPDTAPVQPNAVVGAVTWLEAAMIGNLAMTISIIAVAVFGLMLLTGRISGWRGAQLVLGCFIIFGASGIAHGLAGILLQAGQAPESPPPTVPPTVLSPSTRSDPGLHPYDPYAGAALPPRR